MHLSALRLRLLYLRQLYELTHLSHTSLSPPLVPLSSLTPPREVLLLFLSSSSSPRFSETTSPTAYCSLHPHLPYCSPRSLTGIEAGGMAAHLQATLLSSLPFPSCRCHHPHPLWPSSRPDRNRNQHPFHRPALYPRYSCSHGLGDPQVYRGLHPFHLSHHHHLPYQSRLPPHHPHSLPHLPLVHLPCLAWTDDFPFLADLLEERLLV